RYGVVRGFWRHFLPPVEEGGFFAEQMTIRASPRAPISFNSPYRPNVKSAHRARPDVTVVRGNHDALADGLVPLRGWYPIEILHFRIRSRAQAAKKFSAASDAWSKSGAG